MQIAVSETWSKPFGGPRMLSKCFTWESSTNKETMVGRLKNESGQVLLEKLPMELLGNIIDQLVTDILPNGFQLRNIDLMSLLLTSRVLHSATLATLYSQVTISHSKAFHKFITHVAAHPALGIMVRRLDFSHFNPIGLGMTARERAETQNLTVQTLLQCLKLLPNLQEFLAQEHIDEDLSSDVIWTLFQMPRMQALDFCTCSSTSFRDAIMNVFKSTCSFQLPQVLPITRLSFHSCTILPSTIFESLLPRLPNLTHLDVTHTRITDEALTSIPRTARLTHLSLSKCSSLSGDKVVKFLGTHPAIKDTIVYLNLLMDAKSHKILNAMDITTLLSTLPSTLRSLNLKGSEMSQNHIPLLLPLTKHLEELGIGRNLLYEDISPLLGPFSNEATESASWIPHTLHYLDISDLEPDQLDLGLLFRSKTSILERGTMPLEVIEVGEKAFKKLKDKEHVCKPFGWVVKEAGRRGMLARDMAKTNTKLAGERKVQIDDGCRSWKMGTTYWGMRKVPVARAEVCGMYELCMFKQ